MHPESQLQRQLERIGAVQLTSSLSAHASTQGDGGQVRTLKAALKGTSEKVNAARGPGASSPGALSLVMCDRLRPAFLDRCSSHGGV